MKKHFDPKKGMRLLIPTLATVLALAGASSLSAQTIIYVDGAGGSDANAGDSWANAVATINQAGSLLTPGTDSEIRIAQGTYNENVLIETDDMLLDITGGWNPITENRTVDPTNTVINGGGVNQAFRARDTGPGFNTEIYLRVDGVEFTNGTGNPNDPDDTKRGAVHFSAIFAQITNCAVTNCTVGAEAQHRGVMYWKVGIPANVPEVVDPYFTTSLIENVRFENNTGGDGFGSAIFTEDFNTNGFIRNCQFINNSYTGSAGRGAICVNGSLGGVIENCTFEGNTAPSSNRGAGALTVIGASSITVEDSLFYNNSSREGGAFQIDSASASATFTGCTFRQNTSDTAGGAMYITGGDVTLDSCVLADNSAPNGGAVDVHSSAGDLTAINTVFASNTATPGNGDGGAIWSPPVAEASYTFEGCTFAGNQTTDDEEGGAIFADAMNGILIENSLFIGNSAGRGAVLSSDGLLADGLIMVNCTVAENVRAAGSNQGMFRTNGIPASSSLQFINNLFFNNTLPNNFNGEAVLFHVGAIEPIIDNNLFFPDPASDGTANPLAYRNDGGVTDVAGLNAGVGNDNVGLDPELVMASLSALTGTWTGVQVDTPSSGLTTLTDASASFGGLAGGVINPDTSQSRYAYVVSNTATELVVIGDAFLAAGGASYKYADVSLATASSGAIDRGRSNFPVPSLDILGVTRGFDGDGIVDFPVAGDYDIGAYEFTPNTDVSDWQLYSY